MSQTKIEYETVHIGAALLVRGLLKELGVVRAIDSALSVQPEINATYGHLLQVKERGGGSRGFPPGCVLLWFHLYHMGGRPTTPARGRTRPLTRPSSPFGERSWIN